MTLATFVRDPRDDFIVPALRATREARSRRSPSRRRPRCVAGHRCDQGESCCHLRALAKLNNCQQECNKLELELVGPCQLVCFDVFDDDDSTCASAEH